MFPAAEFRVLLGQLERDLQTEDGLWTLRGFIDTARRVYSLSGDTKGLMRQLTLELPGIETEFIPSTRYQGSKAKLVRWIWDLVEDLSFDTMLDAFGGTGVVGYWFKQKGKQVTYNDNLRFNYLVGLALIENNSVHPTDADVENLLSRQQFPF